MIAIANARGVPGTAALVARDAAGTPFLLASHHVVFGGGGSAGGRVWAFEEADLLGPPVPLGRAARGQLGRVGDDCFIDAALVALDPDPAPWLRAALAALAGEQGEPAAVGHAVTKHGARSGRTEGVVVDTAFRDEPVIEGKAWTATNQLLVRSIDPALAFSTPGDSGAPIVDANDRVIGLLWGTGIAGHGIACPIAPVLAHLEIELGATWR